MPAFLAHFYITLTTARKGGAAYPEAWRVFTQTPPLYQPPGDSYPAISQLAFLGAVAPDLPAYEAEMLGSLFDMFHRKRTGALVANMLELIRKMPAGADRDAALVFTLAFISHIAGDIICHPYINNYAGDYEKQPIPRVFEFWAPFEYHDVKMHMFSEEHQDTYVAMKHFACGDELSNGPGNRTLNSWSDFLNDLITGGLGVMGHNPTGPTVGVIRFLRDAAIATYPELEARITYRALSRALGRQFDALDLGYDMAAGPAEDHYVEEYVNHPWFPQSWHRYDSFLNIAAEVAATKFWPAAKAYLASDGSEGARLEFLKTMGCWSLDTGFNMKVYSVGSAIHIRYEHSWATFLA